MLLKECQWTGCKLESIFCNHAKHKSGVFLISLAMSDTCYKFFFWYSTICSYLFLNKMFLNLPYTCYKFFFSYSTICSYLFLNKMFLSLPYKCYKFFFWYSTICSYLFLNKMFLNFPYKCYMLVSFAILQDVLIWSSIISPFDIIF